MRYCDRHWLMMERAVESVGLQGFKDTDRGRFERIVSALYGFQSAQPDALLSLHGDLTRAIANECGPPLFDVSGGHICPLCFVLEHAAVDPDVPLQGRKPDQYAVDCVAESLHARFVENGVVGKRVLQ